MRIVSLQAIQDAVSIPKAIDAVRDGFIAFAQGRVTQPEPMQLLFNGEGGELFGDCHAKAAQAVGTPYFVIKIATGFYNNPDLGLSVNNGIVLLLSAETGKPLAILQDDGWLTQIRTAAAGALAASLKPLNENSTLGIVGTGTQALLQAQIISAHCGISKLVLFGRSNDKAKSLCKTLINDGLNCRVVDSVSELCYASDVVVTTTPATSPIIRSADVPERLHIIAVGADSPGKIELDPAVIGMADYIATDNHAQCLHHGEFGAAVRAGKVVEDVDISFCELLAGHDEANRFALASRTVVDLTGLGVQDLALASMVFDSLHSDP